MCSSALTSALSQFLGAIVLTAVKSKNAKGSATTVVAFAWMLAIFSAISAYLASRPQKDLDGYPVETEDDRSRSEYEESVV
jgi:hypothetical protein